MKILIQAGIVCFVLTMMKTIIKLKHANHDMVGNEKKILKRVIKKLQKIIPLIFQNFQQVLMLSFNGILCNLHLS